MTTRTYTELVSLPTFEERYHYLALQGTVGDPTFGSERWMNQQFYTSREWRDVREEVTARDNGCDLAFDEFPIFSRRVIHHMNPLSPEQIINRDPDILNLEYLITTIHATHNAIHYGDERQLPRPFVVRSPGDTDLWVRGNHAHTRRGGSRL